VDVDLRRMVSLVTTIFATADMHASHNFSGVPPGVDTYTGATFEGRECDFVAGCVDDGIPLRIR
jgi:hypothetical protein